MRLYSTRLANTRKRRGSRVRTGGHEARPENEEGCLGKCPGETFAIPTGLGGHFPKQPVERNRRIGVRLWGLDRSPSPGPGHSRAETSPTGHGKPRRAEAGDVRSALRMRHLRPSGRENPSGGRGIPVRPPGAVSRSVSHRVAPGSGSGLRTYRIRPTPGPALARPILPGRPGRSR